MTAASYMPSYTWVAATITVTGFAAVAAQDLYDHTSRFLVRVMSTADHGGYVRQTVSIPHASQRLAHRVWCAACRRLVPAVTARDNRLGFRGYCDGCVARLVQRCTSENGRLPTVGEFFCPTCPPGRAVHAMVDLCPAERDGRRRLRCRSCRLEQLRTRRRARRLRIVGRPKRTTQTKKPSH